MPYITINKASYYYEVHGKGQPLVLISGYACDHSCWNLLLDKLVKRFQVLLFDNRGVGCTQDNGEPLSLEKMAEETALLIQALSLSPCVIVGHSMGGMIAQILTNKYPHLVRRLVILNSATMLGMRGRLALSAFIRLLQKRAGLEIIVRTSLPWIFSADFLSTPKSLFAFRKNIFSHPLPETLEDLTRQQKALVAFRGEKSASFMGVPTLVIASREDIIFLPSESEVLAEMIDIAEYVLIRGGHASIIEAPNEVMQAITAFLASYEHVVNVK